MKEQYQTLMNMLDYSPSFNLCSGYSELNSMLSRYLTVLNYFNSYNEEYKGSTTMFYMDISTIRDYIQQSVYATTTEVKEKAFQKAKAELTANIQALAALVQNHEVSIEAMA